jgi:ribulose-5-phosphate 4-epimerase/fuculose-1-phosphate aldolase
VNRAGFVIHSAIHEHVERAHCVMHTHTTTGMAVACLKEGLSPTNFYAAQLHGKVAYHDFEGITVNEDEKGRMLKSIGSKPAVILRNHGLLAWGPSVPEAFMMLWTLQRACDVQIAASSAGALNPIREEVFAQTVRESGAGEKRTCEDVFATMVRLIEAKDPSYRN